MGISCEKWEWARFLHIKAEALWVNNCLLVQVYKNSNNTSGGMKNKLCGNHGEAVYSSNCPDSWMKIFLRITNIWYFERCSP